MKKFFIITMLVFFNGAQSIAIENKILFKINNDIVTTIDIKNESNYLKILNKNMNNLELIQIYEISKNSLIKEKIKKNEILKLIKEIKIEKKILNKLIKSIYLNIGFETKNEFSKYLEKNNMQYSYMEEKLSINALWNQIIYEKFSSKVKIDKKKIKKNILLNKNFSKKYLLSEIVFDIDKNTTLNDKFNLIEENIKQFGFENTALRYSISDTSTSGGKLDWISEVSLNKKILNQINILKIGNHTKPIVVPGGFIIIKLINIKKEEKKKDINKEIEKIIRYKTNQQLNTLSNIYLKKIIKNYQIEYL